MKIATWNIERPAKGSNRISAIEKCLKALNADILILTETNECINPGPGYSAYHTTSLTGVPVPTAGTSTPPVAVSTQRNPLPLVGVPTDRNHTGITAPTNEILYKPGERRTSIYSKYNFIEQLPTFNNETSICIKFQTPLGDLAVYGTIIGILGNRETSFKTDLDLQLKDFESIAAKANLCIAGDLNITFVDNTYYTKEGRDKLIGTLKTLKLVNMTAFIPGNIDHIILPGSFSGKKRDVEVWNTDKVERMSDHMGVAVTIL